MKPLIFAFSCLLTLAHASQSLPSEETKQQEITQQPEQKQEITQQVKQEEISQQEEISKQEAPQEKPVEKPRPSTLKIALVMPKKVIGRLSMTSVDTIVSYLVTRGVDFELKTIDISDEQEETLQAIYEDITNQEFQFIIAILTTQGANETNKLSLQIPVYIPTINVSQIDFDLAQNPMVFFGGISYADQIAELSRLSNQKKIIAYNDDGPLGVRLASTLKELIPNIKNQTITKEDAATFGRKSSTYGPAIKGADIFLNTPVIKSGLLLSQISTFKRKPSQFLSTQINFDPRITLLTQRRDRKNLFITSSIGETDPNLIEYSSLLHSNLKYDWINYSTALGMEMFFHTIFPDSPKFFKEAFVDNQVDYQIQIYSIDSKGLFAPINPALLKHKPIVIPKKERAKNNQEDQNKQDTQESSNKDGQENQNTPEEQTPNTNNLQKQDAPSSSQEMIDNSKQEKQETTGSSTPKEQDASKKEAENKNQEVTETKDKQEKQETTGSSIPKEQDISKKEIPEKQETMDSNTQKGQDASKKEIPKEDKNQQESSDKPSL